VTSERVQRQIDRLLDEAEAAIAGSDWPRVRDRATNALALDPENQDAKSYLAAADRASQPATSSREDALAGTPVPAPAAATAVQPASFANGRYTVRRFLGEGGKKRVYLAHDTLLDRDVALALIKTEGLDDAARERITREAQAMGRLGAHPHIVTVFDIGDENGQPYLVLPVLAGGDVEGVIEKAPEHKLPLEQAIKIAVEACLGLEFVHAKGIVHRDLKPGNVWLTEDGRAMIGDFGLAVAMDRTRLTQAGMMVGTVSYMPPEQAMGGEITPRSDLYALGAMLYEMVCGRPPFVGDESVAIIGQHLNTPPVSPSWHRPDCPPGLEALVLRLLEKDPSRRPESAREVREALQALTRPSGTLSQRERGDGTLLPGGEGGRRPDEGAAPQPQSPDPLYRRTFVGREHEVRQLQQAFDQAVSGNGALVMVVGEPGIGKTALCEQLATYVALRGGKALVGHCYEEGSLSLPYLAFVEAMRSYVLAREPDGLRSDLGSGAADVARIVSEVRDRVQGVELRPAGDPEDDRWRLLQAVTGFLRNASSVQPLCIVLEDLHWADRGTLDLLLHVARQGLQGARLLIAGTYRDVEVDRSHPLSGTLAELRRQGNFLRVPLRGLTVDEVHRMYEALRSNTVPWQQAEAVHRQTEGNPLFVQEVLRFLVEEGYVVRQGSRYVGQAVGLGIPEGLRDVVGRRLNRLGERANQVLSMAAVIGRDFRLDVLQRVAAESASLPEDEVLWALEEAQERAVIEQSESLGTIGFRFTHAFFRQTLYEEIFAPRRIRLHQQIGRTLESVYNRRLEEHAPELAEHFAQSTEVNDLEKAVRYSSLASKRSMSVFAYSEAIRHLEQALRAQEVLDPDDLASRCDLLLLLADAQLPVGEPIRVTDVLAEEAFSLAQSISDPERATEACKKALAGLGRTAPMAQAISSPHARNWPDRADEYARPFTSFRALTDMWLGVRLIRAGRYAEGLNKSLAAYDLARQTEDIDTQFLAAQLKIVHLTTPARWREAETTAREMWLVPRKGVSPRVSLFHQFAGTVFLMAGDRDAWQAAQEELADIAGRAQDANVTISSRHLELARLTMDGQLDEAVDLAYTSIAFAKEAGVYWNIALMIGAVAAGYLGRAEELFAAEPSGREQPAVLAALAGDEALSDSLKRDAEVQFQQNRTEFALFNLVGRAGVPLLSAVIGGIAFRAEDTAAEILSLPESSILGPVQLSMGRFTGAAALMLGNITAARDHTMRAISFCSSIRHRPELALSRFQLAEILLEHYPEERDAAIEHLDFAIAEFREMKMQPSLERALRHRGLLKA
jgi:hypothetical protein